MVRHISLKAIDIFVLSLYSCDVIYEYPIIKTYHLQLISLVSGKSIIDWAEGNELECASRLRGIQVPRQRRVRHRPAATAWLACAATVCRRGQSVMMGWRAHKVRMAKLDVLKTKRFSLLLLLLLLQLLMMLLLLVVVHASLSKLLWGNYYNVFINSSKQTY